MAERTYKSRFPTSLPSGPDRAPQPSNGEIVTPTDGPLALGTNPFRDFDMAPDPSDPYSSFMPSLTQTWREPSD